MNIEEQKKKLLNLIEKYFISEVTVDELFEYSWEIIAFFSENKNVLPQYQESEKSFWYAIWQLQHLADQEHEKNGALARTLCEIVSYLNNQKKMPQSYVGKRPS